jgi:hypothetical protein
MALKNHGKRFVPEAQNCPQNSVNMVNGADFAPQNPGLSKPPLGAGGHPTKPRSAMGGEVPSDHWTLNRAAPPNNSPFRDC